MFILSQIVAMKESFTFDHCSGVWFYKLRASARKGKDFAQPQAWYRSKEFEVRFNHKGDSHFP
jgi:hypothetical protein